jgi:hypothetical protein
MANQDVMIDNETLDTTPSAVILSIGAVRFDQYSHDMEDNAFYAVLDIQDQIDKGRTISADTLSFWMMQPPAARAVFADKEKVSLEDALVGLREWIDPKRDTRPWSMGAGFDIPMLEHAYRSLGMDAPWLFWKACCMRHHKNLPNAKIVYDSVPRLGTHHNAMDDAIHQARCAQAINETLFPAFFRKEKK